MRILFKGDSIVNSERNKENETDHLYRDGFVNMIAGRLMARKWLECCNELLKNN